MSKQKGVVMKLELDFKQGTAQCFVDERGSLEVDVEEALERVLGELL